MKPLAGKVAVVAGATRGAGRAIAIALGEAGATVYATGRSVRGAPSDLARPETIEETAELITARGGQGIPVRVDHTEPEQVKALFERIGDEQGGRLDIIVNDVWGGEKLTEWGTPYWEGSLDKALLMQRRAVHSHMITSYYGAPLLVQRGEGLIVEVTDGYDYRYRGNLPYSLAKVSVIHLAEAQAAEWRPLPSRRDFCDPRKCWIISASPRRIGATERRRSRISSSRRRRSSLREDWPRSPPSRIC